MSNQILKDYVRWHLEQVEASAPLGDCDGPPQLSEDISDMIESDSVSWCRSVDRCLAYTFESYCKLVLSTAMQRAHASHSNEVTAESVRQSVQALFRLPQQDIATPEVGDHHDVERCLCLYRGYATWYQRVGHRIYGVARQRMSNLSLHRLQSRAGAAYANQAHAARKATTRSAEAGLEGRYAYSAPQHKTAEIPLSQVFET
ncbi:hypothetical protein, conserved [Babesia bigemina]|uniref:Uncharacterized protein n=1 Tax=Babesia bigemina TaxID=5866 RepID=A0A061DEI1_BABBI|nr:hypothetical protein, conserved [Babesia bigemina]CDR97320.1 hypothetical protein, conserved [Babesia bigemina]|eukprot:XP_012769506.1 hypothetical protein, conserved [Babesia bigemina]